MAKVIVIGEAGFRKRLLTMEFTRPENNVLNLRGTLRFPCWLCRNRVTIGRRVLRSFIRLDHTSPEECEKNNGVYFLGDTPRDKYILDRIHGLNY